MKGGISEEALLKYNQLVAEKQGLDFAEGEFYDFTTCIRPDGSAYGTSGTCRKGTEGEAKAKNKEIKELETRIKRQETAISRMSPGNFRAKEIEIEKKTLQEMKSKLAGMKSTKRDGSAPVAPVPPKSAMTKKDPVASVLRSQQELRDFNKRENERLAEMIKAGKVKGVTSADLDRIKANRNRG